MQEPSDTGSLKARNRVIRGKSQDVAARIAREIEEDVSVQRFAREEVENRNGSTWAHIMDVYPPNSTTVTELAQIRQRLTTADFIANIEQTPIRISVKVTAPIWRRLDERVAEGERQ